MGRRGHHTFEQLSKMILDSAGKLLATEGCQKVSTRKIADSIGYSVGTLYNIFQNLDDIYINLNGRTIDKMILLINKALLNKKTSPIKSIAYAYIKFSCEEFNSWSLLFEYRFADNIVLPKWYEDKIKTLHDIVLQPLKNILAIDNEEILNQYISVLWSGIHGICVLTSNGKLKRTTGTFKPNTLIDNFIDNYLNGIKFSKL